MQDKIIEGGILLVAFLSLLGSFILVLSKMKDKIIEKLQSIKDELDDDIKNVRSEVNQTRQWADGEFGDVRHEFSETLSALRQRINDVEKEGMERYVRRDSFFEALNRMEKMVSDGMKRLEEFILRVEKRLNDANKKDKDTE